MQTKKLRKRVLSSRRYTPQWKGFIEGYVKNFMVANYWRVANHMGYEDCIQEAHFLFFRLKKKYGNLDTPQHFMTLFKRSWMNEFNDFSSAATKHRKEVYIDDLKEINFEYTFFEGVEFSELENDGELAVMIEQAPSDIKLVLQLLLSAPIEVLDMFRSAWKSRGKYNDFGNTHLCSILGLPDKTDVVEKINNYFCK